jgi:hypothetical protein
LSTIIGLAPFLIAGRSERFWFPLAAGTIGGLIFSVIGLVLFLPVLMGVGTSTARKRLIDPTADNQKEIAENDKTII